MQKQASGQAAGGQSVPEKLEAATLSVQSRDLIRRAEQQLEDDPADEVQPRLNIEDMDEDTLGSYVSSLFHITDLPVRAEDVN